MGRHLLLDLVDGDPSIVSAQEIMQHVLCRLDRDFAAGHVQVFRGVRELDHAAALVITHAEQLAERIHQAHPDGPVCLVAHSLGGLISRYYAQVLGGRVDALVTIGTPHRGTALARGWPMRLARELSPGSQLLRTLTATRSRLDHAKLTSVIAVQDSLVPCHSAALDGSRAVYVDGVGHHGVLFHRHTWAAAENGITLDDARPEYEADDNYAEPEDDTGEHAVSPSLHRVAG